MEPVALRSYRLEFEKRAKWRREDEQRFIDQIKRNKEKERDHAEHDALLDFVAAVLATDGEISDFRIKLDTYDTATVEALMENEKALERVREELRVMTDKAYVLPDGRRVFKTEDGTRLFDQQGTEVKDFDPAQVEDWRPRWERYSAHVNEENALTQERRQLIEYQDLLDKTRERVGEDGLTKDELNDLEKRLEDNMPAAVRRHLPNGNAPAQELDQRDEPQQGASFRPATKLDMPTL